MNSTGSMGQEQPEIYRFRCSDNLNEALDFVLAMDEVANEVPLHHKQKGDAMFSDWNVSHSHSRIARARKTKLDLRLGIFRIRS